MMQSLVLSLLLVSVASFTHSNPPKNPETRKTLLRGRWLKASSGSNSLQIHTSSGSASTKERNEHEHHAHHHEAASKGSASKGASKSTKGSAVSKGASKHGSGSVAPPAHHHKSSGSVPPPATAPTGSTAVPPPQGSGAAPAPATGSTATPPAAPGFAAVPPPAKGSTAGTPPTPEGSTAVPPSPAKGSTAVAPPTTGSGSAPRMPGTDGGHGNGETATCSTIAVKLYTDEITAGGFTAVNGFGLRNVPFYDASSGDKLGTYSDFAITPADTTDRSECVATGAFSFMDANSQDVVSTINLAFTCQSSENAIIGGTGEYGCANGYEQFSTVDETVLSVNLVVCGSLCKS